MKVFDKLKSMKKGWYFFIVIILVVLLIGGGIAKHSFRDRFENDYAANAGQMILNQVSNDLLYLDNFQTLRITPTQAKAILPIVEKMNASTDQKLENDLAKEIYGMLTPSQYTTLSSYHNQSTSSPREKYEGRDHTDKGSYEHWNYKGYDGRYQDPMEQALGNVTINMLKARMQEGATSTSPVAP